MSLSVVQPPDLRRLLKDKVFRRMMTRQPHIPDNLTREGSTPPWHVWLLTTSGTWKRGRYHTYSDAYNLMRRKLRDESVEDIAIVSVRYLMAPPVGFRWNYHQYPWCPRCRRPSLFFERYEHRAVKSIPDVYVDEPFRCFYCGIRRAAFPRYLPR